MDEPLRIFQADQIKVPQDLASVLKNYTKAAIRARCETREEIEKFSVEYFGKLIRARGAQVPDGDEEKA
jgi:hypothetical protein